MHPRLRPAVAVAFLLGAGIAVQAAQAITVIQRGLQFNVTSLALAKDDRIVFTNEDDVIHNIHVFGPDNDENTDLGLQKPRATLSYKFDKPGTYRVRCNIHPSMRLTVTVK